MFYREKKKEKLLLFDAQTHTHKCDIRSSLCWHKHCLLNIYGGLDVPEHISNLPMKQTCRFRSGRFNVTKFLGSCRIEGCVTLEQDRSW